MLNIFSCAFSHPYVFFRTWKITQLCPTLCDPMDNSVHGILQARILEWVAFPFSGGSSQSRNKTQVSCIPGGFFSSWATRETPKILECVPYPFSRESSWPRIWTGVCWIVGRFFTNWTIRDLLYRNVYLDFLPNFWLDWLSFIIFSYLSYLYIFEFNPFSVT